jgi:hypothetical protein
LIELLARGGYLCFVRAILSFLVSSALCASLLFAFVPAQAASLPVEKASCCAKMEAKAEAGGCAKHAPKSDQEKQCCTDCGFCLAALVTRAAIFVYPPNGDQSFRTFVLREFVRSDKPRVPPPRSALIS